METIINSLKINYVDRGSGDSTVLLLHGWGSKLDLYEHIMRSLEKTHRVLALDFPGCGGSGLPQEPLTLDDYCNLVLEFIKQTGAENLTLIGHSHGGRVILKLVGSGMLSPKKIVLLDSAGLIPKKSFRQKWRAKSFKIIKRVLTLPVIRRFSGGLLDKARNHYGSADYNAAPLVMRQTLVHLVNIDLRDILSNITCPTLLIWGEKDTATPLSDAKIIESSIKDCGLCVIEGGSHFAFLEDIPRVNAILKSFLG